METDISKDAVEALAVLQEDDFIRPDGYIAADTLRAQSDRIAELEAQNKELTTERTHILGHPCRYA